MTNRITWVDGRYTTRTGLVNEMPMFTITYSTIRGEGYTLQTQLPVSIRRDLTRGDPDELKATAERVLELFVSKLGAAFPE